MPFVRCRFASTKRFSAVRCSRHRAGVVPLVNFIALGPPGTRRPISYLPGRPARKEGSRHDGSAGRSGNLGGHRRDPVCNVLGIRLRAALDWLGKAGEAVGMNHFLEIGLGSVFCSRRYHVDDQRIDPQSRLPRPAQRGIGGDVIVGLGKVHAEIDHQRAAVDAIISVGRHVFDEQRDGPSFRRVEVLSGAPRRRRWSAEEKAAVVAASLAPDAVARQVALRHGAHPNQLYAWRRELASVDFDGTGPNPAQMAWCRSSTREPGSR